MKIQCFVAAVVFAFALFSSACNRRADWENLVGQRLLGFQIQIDGEVRYTGVRSVNDNIPASEVWDVIGTVEFEAKDDGETETHLADGTSRTVLGSIVVRFAHGSFGDERTVDRLALRSDNAGKSWSLSDSDVERLKQASRAEP